MRSVIAGNHMGHGVDPGQVVPGEVVARVVESDDPDWQPGTLVRCQGGWQRFSDHRAGELSRLPAGLSRPSLALSILGMPGLTAWAGMVHQAKVRAGDVVVIPAAVGGVGAMAAQLARRAGATTIAVTSGKEKRRIALETLGYDHCIDRVDEDLSEALSRVAPEGVSVYFDLVGDPTLTTVAQQLSIGGRVVLCGLKKITTVTTKPLARIRDCGSPSARPSAAWLCTTTNPCAARSNRNLCRWLKRES